MKVFNFKNTVVASCIGLITLVGTAAAQNSSREYRQWQEAQAKAQREYRDYQRSGSRSDYRQWQEAQARAQREAMDYQRSTSRYNGNYNRTYNRTYNNVGVYNNNGNTVYNPRTGQYYRVYNNGAYYQTDQRGVNLLRQAVNSGYQQGYRQGQVDRRYGRGSNYYGNSIYSSGSYGYDSYVDRSQYQYYFQQGFQRGYQDGYNGQYTYGYRSGNSYNVLGTILNGILQLSR